MEFLSNSTGYTAKVRYSDRRGGYSPFDTDTFNTTAENPKCPDLNGLAILVGLSPS